MGFRQGGKTYRYSFSGSDAQAYAWFEGLEESVVQLESLHTVSISVHEAKGQARSLGYKGVKGFSKSIRTIAGSMILTVIEDHPLRPLINTVEDYAKKYGMSWGGWSIDRDSIGVGTALNRYDFVNRLATTLPEFNLLVTYVSEGAEVAAPTNQEMDIVSRDPTISDIVTGSGIKVGGAAWLARGIEIMDVGMVTSTNDIVTEITMSFLAYDFKPISGNRFDATSLYVRNRDEELHRSFHGALNRRKQEALIPDDYEEAPTAAESGGLIGGWDWIDASQPFVGKYPGSGLPPL